MAKKTKTKIGRRASNRSAEKNISVSKQAVGGVTGAVMGGMVGGPIGAIAGGIAGTVIGEQSAQGKRPVARAANAVSEEVRKGTPMKALKSVAGATASIGRGVKKATASSAGRKKAKSASRKKATTTSKRKTGKKVAKSTKRTKKR